MLSHLPGSAQRFPVWQWCESHPLHRHCPLRVGAGRPEAPGSTQSTLCVVTCDVRVAILEAPLVGSIKCVSTYDIFGARRIYVQNVNCEPGAPVGRLSWSLYHFLT